MKLIEGMTFEREEVKVDGKHFKSCEFIACSISHEGDDECEFERCRFRSCEWIFAGGVERDIKISG